MKKTVGSVLITFNRLELLKKILLAIKSQTVPPDEIFVINNSSSDGTLEWLNSQEGITIITQPNTGSSGGQYTGFKAAYDKGYDLIWTMDDDVIPEPDCLEKLIGNFDDNTIRTPLRFTNEQKVFFNDTLEFNLTNPFKGIWKSIISDKDLNQEVIPAVGITFEGPVIPRKVIEKIGLPMHNFFIFADDSEYFIRAAKIKANIVIVKSAKLNRQLPVPDLTKEFSWKNYYIIRNIIAIDKMHGNFAVKFIRPFGYLIKWLFRAKTLSEIKTVFKSFFDGYFYKPSN
jgi:GT2 family glycosyltransferase